MMHLIGWLMPLRFRTLKICYWNTCKKTTFYRRCPFTTDHRQLLCNFDADINHYKCQQTTHIAEEIILDYSEAQSKLKEEENMRRVEEGLTVGLTKEVRFAQSPLFTSFININRSVIISSIGRRRV
jgi:hypothetical protein